MEEVDNIIIHSLRQVGCDIEDDIDSLKNFTTELVVEAAVRCLDVIQPGLGLPHSLPESMSARFRIGASIAQACKSIGYPGDIGYQTFLYSSEADVRRVLMFLIEKLPKESEKSIVEPAGRAGLIEKAVGEALRKQLSSPWLPSYCRRKGVRWYDDGTWSKEGCGHYQPFISCKLSVPKSTSSKEDTPEACRQYYVRHLPTVTDQVQDQCQLLPSLITLNSEGLLPSMQQESPGVDIGRSQRVLECLTREFERCSTAVNEVHAVSKQDNDRRRLSDRKSRFALSERLQFSKEPVPSKKEHKTNEVQQKPELVKGAERRKGKEEEMQQAKEETEKLRERLEILQLNVKKLTAKLAQVTEESSNEERALREKEERQSIKKRTFDLLPEADTNIQKLQALVEATAQKLVSLATQWEKHRVPLLNQYRDARERNSNKASESQRKMDAVRSLREKARELSDEVRQKEQLHSQLLAEYEKVTKDINRSAYTRRIMEIIGNIKKQKDEINKVLNDTKELQKEINNLTGRLDRSFTVADELIFRDAKKDETARRAYKLLATLHSDCAELVQMVEETGAIIREIRDLEEQIETESAKNVGANLERISADLRQMKQETAALTAQLNAKS